MARMGLFALTLLACTIGAEALVARTAPIAGKKDVTPAEVLALHKQLETIGGKFDKMLNDKDGAMAHAKVAPAMREFVKELQSTLTATTPDKKVAPAVAMEKLNAAKAGLASLMHDLSSRQEDLMKEDNAQRESLLLGVLMTHQKDAMDKQLEILKDGDFAGLEVAKALVAKHNATTPLYVQAGMYLDAHPNRKSAPMVAAKDPKVKMQQVLEKHLATLQHEYDSREKFHLTKVAEFAKTMKAGSSKEQHSAHIRAKREDRQFKKWAVMRKHDIKALTEAVEGVKKGDMKAVGRAREALTKSLQAMKSQSNGFLYLLQMHNSVMQQDCPYCAAQCVDKCHTAGKPYVQCLTDCADAGK